MAAEAAASTEAEADMDSKVTARGELTEYVIMTDKQLER